MRELVPVVIKGEDGHTQDRSAVCQQRARHLFKLTFNLESPVNLTSLSIRREHPWKSQEINVLQEHKAKQNKRKKDNKDLKINACIVV